MTTLHPPRRLVGIVSWGPTECGHADYPAVYTKVSVVRDWIIRQCALEKMPMEITKAYVIP